MRVSVAFSVMAVNIGTSRVVAFSVPSIFKGKICNCPLNYPKNIYFIPKLSIPHTCPLNYPKSIY